MVENKFSEYSLNDTKWLSDNEVNMLIQGLHFIELRYRIETGYSFGFGSPSRTHQLIHELSKRNTTLATELSTWIASNGGNYYIKPLPGEETETLPKQSGLFD